VNGGVYDRQSLLNFIVVVCRTPEVTPKEQTSEKNLGLSI